MIRNNQGVLIMILIKFLKIFLLLILLLNSVSATSAVSEQADDTIKIQSRINELTVLLGIEPLSALPEDKRSLPYPYEYLLTQPLITLGISNYYRRVPIIQVLNSFLNTNKTGYSRVITMYIDPDLHRNKPEIAHKNKQDIIVELAFIKINFRELPAQMVSDILNKDIPFGKLLVNNGISILNKNQRFFSLKCSSTLARIMHCKTHHTLYGRINTLIRADNKKAIADTIEILAGVQCKTRQCISLQHV